MDSYPPRFLVAADAPAPGCAMTAESGPIARLRAECLANLRYINSLSLLDAWIACDEGAVFDPLNVPQLLPYLYLLDREGDRLRYRVSGEAVNALFGGQHTGRYLDQVVPAHIYPHVSPYFMRVITGDAICFFQGRIGIQDREFMHFERLLLPIHRYGRTMLLGCLSLSGMTAKRAGADAAPEQSGYHFTLIDRHTGTVDRAFQDILAVARPIS